MPRRKQGHCATGGYLKKKTDTELIENESLKSLPTKKDLVHKIQKTNSGIISNSTYEKIERQHLDTSKSLNDMIMVSKHEVNNNFEFVKEQDENSNSRNVLENTCCEPNHITSNNRKISNDVCSENLWDRSSTNFKDFKNRNDELSEDVPMKKSKISRQTNSSAVKVIRANESVRVKTFSVVNDAMTLNSQNQKSETEFLCNSLSKKLQSPSLNNSQMSGIQPVVTSSDSKNCLLDSQMNYRVSTSVIESRSNQTKSATDSVMYEKNNCHLPSSVYGSPASSIEKVLTALQTANKNEENESSATKVSFLQELLQKKSTETSSSKIPSVQLNNNKNESNSNSSKLEVENVKVDSSNLDFCIRSKSETFPSLKLKLHIPEVSCNDDSNSSAMSFDSSKAGKITKITSPQILEQHISKIISENAAIVETLDPKWSRRYFKQSSLSSSPTIEVDPKKCGFAFKANRTEIKLPASSNIAEGSKLHSALIGDPEINVNYVQMPAMYSLKSDLPSDNSQVTGYSSTIPVTYANKMANSVTEEELKGSAIKSLLCLKQGRYLKHTSSVYSDQDFSNQNPEGSTIKDLLLKSKTKESKFVDVDTNVSSNSLVIEGNKNVLYKISPFKCLNCCSEFSEKHGLDVHMSFCKSASKHQFTLRDMPEKSKLNNAQNYMELPNTSKTHGLEDTVENDAGVGGPILKKQLLLPLSKSPPMKKRKVSDSVLSTSQSEHTFSSVNHFLDRKMNNFPMPLEALSPHRSRSHSVHLVGGEVKILDGDETKKLKIQTSVTDSCTTVTNKFPDSFRQKALESIGSTDLNHLPPVLVTFAQPVHNSGGTVLLPNCRTSVSPFVSNSSLVNSIIKYPKSEKLSIDYTKNVYLNESKQFLQNESSLLSTSTSSFTSSAGLNSKPFSFYSSLPNSDSKALELMPGSVVDEISPLAMHIPISPNNKPFYSPIFAADEKTLESTITGKDKENQNNSVLPTVIFTPSSPTRLANDSDVQPVSSSTSEPNKKYLAPTRPTSLPLKKNTFTMVGSTLISPETPRPKKTCIQLYLNGHAYTYLGLKCSTRSTYCSIYRPQPMFVLQGKNSKLSMYSNWQVVPAKEELSGLTPGQMISFYCSKQKKESTITSTAKLGEPLIFTHSSYWTYRSTENSGGKENVIDTTSGDSGDAEMVEQQNQNTKSEHTCCFDPVIPSSSTSKTTDTGHQSDESNLRLDTDNTLSEEGDVNNSDGDDDDDCQDDGTESLTDSSLPQPPKRVKIFEGGFKSNEDYTYVRGRGRGKYVCEECGIRCKKPSMLKKHIRTHTDLRPYKCRHCSFAFKTKGNLTKHMKSKAHHKKCTELGIIPVPTTTDDSQIDQEALAKQIAKKKTQFSDGEDADDDDDDDETDETDDECESDTCSMIISTSNSRMLTNGHNKIQSSADQGDPGRTEENQGIESVLQQSDEQEAARSLLHLSAIGEPSQWSTSTGDLTDVASSSEADISSLGTRLDPSLSSPQYAGQSMESVTASNSRSKPEQWLSTETLGHRPRSYSADIPLGGGKELLTKYRLMKGAGADETNKGTVDDSEFASRDQYTRRYSISVAREARKPRIIQPPEWNALGLPTSTPKWPEDQPMDLSISRDLSKYKTSYGGGALFRIVTQEEPLSEQNIQSSLESINDSYSVKSLPVLSPQVVDYELPVDTSTIETPLLPMVEDQTTYSSASRPLYFVQDIPATDTSGRKENEASEDPQSPEIDYAACSPVSPSTVDENSYYYNQEGVAHSSSTTEDGQSSSRAHAEFIVPSSSSSMEEGKCVCRICNKIFAKSSHLRLHVNIHYFERPFRCDNCAVSFRTKGHLQKHKRSVSHYNKVNMNLTFGTPTVDNPRPFKCADCKIAFRIHGHLAKHLRSKMHIMKLECLGKLPFGMYAEMERSGVSLNEIDTTDCNNSLESLQVMAQKLYQRDPRRMRWQGPEVAPVEAECNVPATTVTSTLLEPILSNPEPIPTVYNPSYSNIGLVMPAIATAKPVSETGDVKHEPSELNSLRIPSSYSDGETSVSVPRYAVSQPVSTNQEILNQRSDIQENDSVALNRSGTCHLCGKAFKSAKFLQVHLYSDHSSVISSIGDDPSTSSVVSFPVTTINCDLCGRTYPNQKALQQHLLSHAQPRPFVCEVCDAGFTSSSSLIAHQSTHQTASSVSSSAENKLVQRK